MEKILLGSLKAAVIGGLLYVCWFILPEVKRKYVAKFKGKLEEKGLKKTYDKTYKVIKTILYIILASLIILPIVFLVSIFK